MSENRKFRAPVMDWKMAHKNPEVSEIFLGWEKGKGVIKRKNKGGMRRRRINDSLKGGTTKLREKGLNGRKRQQKNPREGQQTRTG